MSGGVLARGGFFDRPAGATGVGNEGMVGADRYQRGDGRQTARNGYRDRELKTRMGALTLRVPKLRTGP